MFDRVEYLVPAEKATPLASDCAEQAEQLADALELGRQLRIGTPDKNRLCAAFAARHGLLGLTDGLVPQPIWEAHSMYEVLRLSYAMLMT